MKPVQVVKDHLLIGGNSALVAWVFFCLVVVSEGVVAFVPVIPLGILVTAVMACAFTANGIYALNAYYDVETDRINKPGRPLPSGRMTPQHALNYAQGLMALGLLIALGASALTGQSLMVTLWTIFTLLGIAYSMPPLKLKARHILGNLCFAAFTTITMFIHSLWGDLCNYWRLA